jgi:hypothetical protein
MSTLVKKGDRLVVYADRRPAERLFIEVTRVATDGTWADIRVCTWAVMWTKRQKLHDGLPPAAVHQHWDALELDEQQSDWDDQRKEEAT